MRISVEQKHIDNAIRFSTTDCPIALAVKETTGAEWVSVWVGNDSSAMWVDKQAVKLPKSAHLFATRFDCRMPIKPTKFNVSDL